MGNSGLYLCPPGLGQKRVKEAHGKVVAVSKDAFREAVAEGKVMRKTIVGRPVERAPASGPVERAPASGPVERATAGGPVMRALAGRPS